jgi:hypothetical protein
VKKAEIVVFSTICKHAFCSGCLKEHVEGEIRQFKEVKCPNSDCSEILDVSSKAFQGLSVELKERYYKILIVRSVNSNSNQRFCPKEDCQGYLDISEKPCVCVACGTVYCSNCMMKEHDGACDDFGVDFL